MSLPNDLQQYLDAQSNVTHLRSVEMPNFPWPDNDNPVIGYLMAEAERIAAKDGYTTAMLWICVHAWYEGAINAVNRKGPPA